jgi:Ricin-type beta-trefoil lectin domain-like
VARHSGKCVDVVGSSTADGALLEQRTCTTANNMLWSRTVR